MEIKKVCEVNYNSKEFSCVLFIPGIEIFIVNCKKQRLGYSLSWKGEVLIMGKEYLFSTVSANKKQLIEDIKAQLKNRYSSGLLE